MDRGSRRRQDKEEDLPHVRAAKEEILPGYEDYLVLLQERKKDRLLKKLRKKDKSQIDIERKEQGLSVYVNGPHKGAQQQHASQAIPTNPTTARAPKTAGAMGSKVPSSRKRSEEMSEASGATSDEASGANSISQWVEKVVNYSSQYDPKRWCADCVIGPPKVYPRYGDIPGAWASKAINNTQFIELHYKQAVYIQQINIYETFNAGGVKKVQGRTDGEGEWHVLWKAYRVECIKQSRIFSPPIENHQMKFSELRIEVDCTAANTWSEIDAVEIVGITTHLPSPPNLEELSNNLSVLVNNETFSDVHFLVDDRKLYAHKALLMARSDYFKAMFCNNMKEAKERDSITLKDVQFDGFYALLHFTYTNKIPDYYKPEQLLEIWRVADRFSVEGLKSLVAHKVCHSLDNDNVVSIYCEATNTLPIIDDIKNSCVEYMTGRMPSVVNTKPFENLPKDIMLEIIQLTSQMKIT